MTTSSAANQGSASVWQAHDVAGWFALASSPTCAVMAWVVANDASRTLFCAAGSSILPIGGMTAMYLLMSLVHLSPWLKLVFGRPWART